MLDSDSGRAVIGLLSTESNLPQKAKDWTGFQHSSHSFDFALLDDRCSSSVACAHDEVSSDGGTISSGSRSYQCHFIGDS